MLVFLVFSASASFESLGQKKFEQADVTKLTGLGDPQISPDGKSIVVVVSKPDLKENRFNSELVSLDIATGKQTILTHNRSAVAQPRWSPSGEYLAFLSRTGTGKDAANQLYVLPMRGGEARQATKALKGVQHYSWSPDGNHIAYVGQDEPSNKTEIERGHTFFEVGNNDMFINSQPTPSHISIVDVNNGQQKKLTSGNWSLPVTISPGPPSSPLSWSPDGKSIAFVKVTTPYSGDAQHRTVQIISVSDGRMTPISSRKQFESYPVFSPDGNSLSYWYKKGSSNSDINEVWVAPAKGGGAKT